MGSRRLRPLPRMGRRESAPVVPVQDVSHGDLADHSDCGFLVDEMGVRDWQARTWVRFLPVRRQHPRGRAEGRGSGRRRRADVHDDLRGHGEALRGGHDGRQGREERQDQSGFGGGRRRLACGHRKIEGVGQQRRRDQVGHPSGHPDHALIRLTICLLFVKVLEDI
jgi:hypothetical protein